MSPWKGASFESDNSKQEAAGAFNVIFQEGYYCDRNYVLKVSKQARTTPTKWLVIAELQPKEKSLPSFSFRWDEKANSLDVDIQEIMSTVKSWFEKGIRGYAGHRPKEVTSEGRIFEVDIRIPNTQVFRGCLSFDLIRNTEVRVPVARVELKVNAPVDMGQE